MDPSWSPVICEIHSAAVRLVVAVTGGGARALAALLSTPGASRTMLLALSPYSAASLVRWIGARPEQFCSESTARTMAMRAYLEARSLESGDKPLVGVGCTASLASDRPKRGDHRAWIALQTAEFTRTVGLEFDRAARLSEDPLSTEARAFARQRDAEEELLAAAILNEIAAVAGASAHIELKLASADRRATREKTAPLAWQDLLAGRREAVLARTASTAPASPVVLFPGAFHPLHQGHRQMASIASRRLREPVDYEISIFNVDKPPLDFLEIDQRTAQFAALAPPPRVWLTRAPTFLEKAQLFPGCTFVVGMDTLERIAEPRYYGGETERQAALKSLADLKSKFLVFGRRTGDRFESLSDVPLPATLASLCTSVPESEFRDDVSSTELRRRATPPTDG